MIKAAIIAALTGLLLACAISHASPIEDFQAGYAKGTAFAELPDFAETYARSENRQITLTHVVEEPHRTTAYYSTTMLYDGKPLEETGVLMLHHEPLMLEWARVDPALIDMALAGQGADIGSTALALSSGLAEGNPIVGGAIGSPIGIAVVAAVKLGIPAFADRWSLSECVGTRAGFGALGWGAAAWNVAMMSGVATAPALVLGGLIGWWGYGASESDAPTRCVRKIT